MNLKPKIERKDEKQPDERTDAHTNLMAALGDLELLIEHFDHPSYNPAQLRVMRKVKGHINAAAAQLVEIAGASRGEDVKDVI